MSAQASASGAAMLGLLAAYPLQCHPRLRARRLFVGMVNAPLVMPEVSVSLWQLLMLVSLQRATGFPERGQLTIWLGHLTTTAIAVRCRARCQVQPPHGRRKWLSHKHF